MKFQINKTELQRISKDLKIREAALPTLKSKEAALRHEIKIFKDKLFQKEESLKNKELQLKKNIPLFSTWHELISIDKLILSVKKIAGIRTKGLDDIIFKRNESPLLFKNSFYLDLLNAIEDMARDHIFIQLEREKIALLEHARKKTTQKVNLYEKVQIPSFKEAIIMIKRFLEDEENLNRAGQKIIKKRKAL